MEEQGVLFHLSPNVVVTIFDVLLLFLGPLCGLLGGAVARHIHFVDFLKAHSDKVISESTSDIERTPLKIRNSAVHMFRNEAGPNPGMVGAVLGFVVALYFIGAVSDHLTSLARILALCILLGYQAPSLWRTQERIVSNIVEEKVKAILGQNSK